MRGYVQNFASQKEAFSSFLNFFPGLVILFFAMIALNSSLRVIEFHGALVSLYKNKSQDILELEDAYNKFEESFVVHAENLPEDFLRNAELRLKNFTEVYYDLKEHEEKGVVAEKENYIHAFNSIESEFVVLSGHIETASFKSGELRDVLAPIRNKIENLWVALYNEKEASQPTAFMQEQESLLYWSVLALGLSGFVLVLLNGTKLGLLRKANEEKMQTLKLLQDRIAAIETTFDGIGIVDKNGNLSYMNRALMALHGIKKIDEGQFLGKSWKFLYSGKGRAEIESVVLPALEKAGYWRGESPILRRNGEVVHADLSLTTLPDGGFIGTARDITENKRAEKKNELLQAQFYQAQKMEAIGRLAGGIAHDFNNILAAMNGYAEFLIEDLEQDTAQYKFAANILQAGQQARGLVDQILAFSRRRESSMENVDLVTSAHETLSMIRVSLPKTIEVRTNIAVSEAHINGNATQISQALMNLCVNAQDAMEEHGTLTLAIKSVDSNAYKSAGIVGDAPPGQKTPVIRIEDAGVGRTRLFLGVMEENMRYVSVSVQDTGSGIDRLVMEHIFEPFFTTKPVDKGTGLGLATVHGVVAGHNGVMVVDSKIGEGTLFELFFPMAEMRAHMHEPGTMPAQPLTGRRVLLVEDQEEVREMMMTMMERLGMEACSAGDGLEALDILRQNQGGFDLVITDQNMPRMTGIELIQKAYPDLSQAPFIMLSGYNEKKLHDIINAHPAIRAVLRKPVSRNALAQKIASVLDGRDVQDAAGL